jgi:hypothetical protein
MHIAIPAVYVEIAVVVFILTWAMIFVFMWRQQGSSLTPTRSPRARSGTPGPSPGGEHD